MKVALAVERETWGGGGGSTLLFSPFPLDPTWANFHAMSGENQIFTLQGRLVRAVICVHAVAKNMLYIALFRNNNVLYFSSKTKTMMCFVSHHFEESFGNGEKRERKRPEICARASEKEEVFLHRRLDPSLSPSLGTHVGWWCLMARRGLRNRTTDWEGGEKEGRAPGPRYTAYVPFLPVYTYSRKIPSQLLF